MSELGSELFLPRQVLGQNERSLHHGCWEALYALFHYNKMKSVHETLTTYHKRFIKANLLHRGYIMESMINYVNI